MNIECNIKNVNSSTYPKILFRKFFQIIFFDEEMKKIDIYTATIFGGSNEKGNDISYSNFCSDVDEEFKIKFTFTVKDINNDSVVIKHKDLTKSFLKQANKTKFIWGDLSKYVSEQDEIEEKLKNVLNTYKSYRNCTNSGNCDKCDKNKECEKNGKCLAHKECNTCNNFSLIELEDKKTNSNSYLYVSDEEEREVALAIGGEADINDEERCFTINGQKELHRGVEVLNWIHTTMEFTNEQYIDLFKYKIELPNGELFTSDFTLYIGPQEGYTLTSGTIRVNGGRSIPNSFQEVGKSEDLYFDEWKENCNILNKKMHRVLLKEKLFNLDDKKIKGNKIELSVNFKDEVGKEDFQFALGIIISTTIAFGIDYTRIGQISKCFIPFLFMPDIQWIASCLLIVYVIWKSRLCKESAKSKKEHKIITIIGGGGISLIVLWCIATLVIYQGYINDCLPWNYLAKSLADYHFVGRCIYNIVLGIGLALCGTYAVFTNTRYKKDYLYKKIIDVKKFFKK